MDKIFKWKSYFLIGISTILIIILFADIFSIWSSPEEYEKIYDFSNNAVEWRFKSVFNYIFSDVIGVILLTLYIVLNLIFILKKINFMKYILIIIEISVCIYFVFNFYKSYITGFDH